MLVLSRQEGESIMIGPDIEVCVIDVRGDKVKLGIRAPSDIQIDRREIYEQKRRESQNPIPLQRPYQEPPAIL